MRAFGEAFYGRSAAYDMALTESSEAFAQALCRNILNGEKIERARDLAAYAEATMAALEALSEAALLGGAWKFPLPQAARAQ